MQPLSMLVARRHATLAGLLGLALALRLPRLGESLWYDEVYYSTRQRFDSWAALVDSLAGSLPAPVYRVVLFGWTALFGEAEWVVRLPSLFCGLGSIALATAIARARGGERLAVAVGLWLALSPAHVWYSQEATPYAMAMCLALAAVWLGDLIADRPSAGRLALFAALLLGAVLTHLHVAALLGSFAVVAVWSRPPARWRWLAVVAAIGLAFAVLLRVKASAGGLRMSQGFLREFDAFEAWMLPFHWFLQGNSLWTVNPYRATAVWLFERPLLVALQVAACGLFLRGVGRALSASKRRLGLPLVLHTVALPAAVAALGLVGYRQLYIERYLVVALPLFAVLLLRGASDLGGRRVGAILIASLVALNAAAYVAWWIKDDEWTVYKQNPDWLSAAAALHALEPERGTAVVLSATPADALDFHLRRLAGTARPEVRGGARFDFDDLDAATRRVYVVQNRYWRGDHEWILRRLDEDGRFARAGVLAHRGVWIQRYERPALDVAPLP